jgi:hypothetical protein
MRINLMAAVAALWLGFIAVACGGVNARPAPQPAATSRNAVFEQDGFVMVSLHDLMKERFGPPEEGAAALVRDQTEKSLVHDQPRLRDVVRWNGRWVVKADRLYVLDLAAGSVRPLEHPGMDRTLEIVGAGERSFLLGKTMGRRQLVLVSSAGRDMLIDLPLEVMTEAAGGWQLAAGGDRLVITRGPTAFHCKYPGCRWSRLALNPQLFEPLCRYNQPKLALQGPDLFVGVDCGEWGGALWSVSLESGKATWVDDDGDNPMPVSALATDAKGRLWATWGLSHMMGLQGTVRVREHGGWRLVSSCQNGRPLQTRNWPLFPTSFEGMATSGDRVYLLTATQGIIERANGTWIRRTFGWPRGVGAEALGIDGQTAIIGTRSAGILLWDLVSNTRRVVRMPPAEVGTAAL